MPHFARHLRQLNVEQKLSGFSNFRSKVEHMQAMRNNNAGNLHVVITSNNFRPLACLIHSTSSATGGRCVSSVIALVPLDLKLDGLNKKSPLERIKGFHGRFKHGVAGLYINISSYA